MSRGIIVASAVFGRVVAVGVALIPSSATDVGDPAPDVSCGNLITYDVGGAKDARCDQAARSRRLTVVAGLFLAVISSGVLRRAKPTSLDRQGPQ